LSIIWVDATRKIKCENHNLFKKNVRREKMKQKLSKLLLVTMAVLVLALSFSGCTAQVTTTSAAAATTKSISTSASPSTPASTTAIATTAKKTFKVGWSIDTITSPYNAALDTFVKEAWAKYPEVTLYSSEAQAQSLKQVSDIEDLVNKGVNLLMIKARDEMTVTEALKSARDKGVIIMLLDRNVKTENYDYYIGVDAPSLGTVLGTEFLKTFPVTAGKTYNYVYLEGTAGTSTNLDQIQAFTKVIANSNRTDIKLVGNQPSNAKRDEAKKLMLLSVLRMN
jgi:ribose transport system substrate-binding protein